MSDSEEYDPRKTWGETKTQIDNELKANGMGDDATVNYIDFDPEITKIYIDKGRNSFQVY